MNASLFVCAAAAALGACASLLPAPPASPASAQPDLLSPPPNGPRKSDPTWAALADCTLHAKPGESVEHATVIIRDGRIAAVLPPEPGAPEPGAPNDAKAPIRPAAVPPGPRVWNCSGLHIYAAFIDPYVEVDSLVPGADAPGRHWNARVTPERSAMDGKGPDAATAEALRKLGFGAAAISPKGGIFRGGAAVVSLAKPSDDRSDARPPVYLDHPYLTVAFEGRSGPRGGPVAFTPPPDDGRWPSYPDSQMGAIALIRQTLLDADWQSAARKAGQFNESRNCLDSLVEPTGVGVRLLFDTADELESLRAEKILHEFGRPGVILGSGTEFKRLAALSETPARAYPLIVPLNFPEKPKVASIGAAEAVELRTLMTWEQAPTNVRRLDGAGLNVSLTTSRLKDRAKFRDNLRAALKPTAEGGGGLAEDRALAMLTTNPAEVLGVSATLGTIEPGKTANLLITDGPVFAEKTKVRDVWIDGRRHEINAPPSPDLTGEWEVTVEPPPPAPARITLTIDKDNNITIRKIAPDAKPDEKPAESKAREVRVTENRISFVFDHDPFGEKGIFTNSGLIETRGEPGGVGDAIVFTATRSSGVVFTWTAKRLPPKPAVEPPAPAGERPAEQPGANPAPGAPAAAQPAAPPGEAGAPPAPAKPDKVGPPPPPVPIPESYGYPFGAYALDQPSEQPDSIIVRNATLWTSGPLGIVEPGKGNSGTELVIEKGNVVYVGAARSRPTPAGAVVIDATGKHITSGLIDCHSHTGISKGVNESGQAVTAEVRIQDVTDPDAMNWYRQLAGGLTIVNNLHGSANPIGGQNCVNKIRWGCLHPDEMHLAGRDTYPDDNPLLASARKPLAMPGIKFALGENVKQSNWGDRNTTRYPQTRMGVETIFRDRFTAAREYAAAWKKAAPGVGPLPPHRDLELEALAQVLDGTRIIHCHSYRQDEILMLCRIADEFGFKLGTFQHNLEGYKVADAVRDHTRGASLFSDWWAYKVEVQDAIPYAGPIMHDAGVVVSYNSDSDELARRLNVEASKAVKYSHGTLAPEEALKFVTINPARQLAIDEHVGSLEPGKDGDFVIWSGPPLSTFSRCEQTWIDGRCYFSLERDAKLRVQNAADRARILQKLLAQDTKADKEGKDGAKPGDGPARAGRRRPGADDDDSAWLDTNGSADTDSLTSGTETPQRHSILFDSIQGARDARRDYYLDLIRRGIDPRFARCAECGQLLSTENFR